MNENFDQPTVANITEPALEPTVVPAVAAVTPKRRGRPSGTGRTPAASKPNKRAKQIAPTAAAFAILADLAGDQLAVAVHGASASARTLIAHLLKAGI